MSPTLQAAHQVSRRVSPCSFLQVVATTRSRYVKLAATASSSESKRGHEGNRARTATNTTFSSTDNSRSSSSSAPFGKMLLPRRAGPKRQYQYIFSQSMCSLSCSLLGRPSVGAAAVARAGGPHSNAAPGGYIRAFGGQSVVPWELALFLVEEMKGEMVQPGAVVYTAALAECRWAGEQRHVDYLLQEMEAEGLSIVPGIPGAMDCELPPSQAPPLFGRLPETPPGGSNSNPQRPSTATPTGTVSAMQAAARAADAALATVETMWARAEHEPSPATCRAALDACAAGGQWERALSMVRDAAMVIAADGADVDADAGNGGGEEEGSVSGRVEALALEGKWNEALSLVQGEAGLSDEGGSDKRQQ